MTEAQQAQLAPIEASFNDAMNQLRDAMLRYAETKDSEAFNDMCKAQEIAYYWAKEVAFAKGQ